MEALKGLIIHHTKGRVQNNGWPLAIFQPKHNRSTKQTCNHSAICADLLFSRNPFQHILALHCLYVHTHDGQSIFQMANQTSHWLAIMS